MVINFPAMTFKMFPKNIFFCRSDIYKCKDFLFFSLPLKSTTEHECTLNFRKFLKIHTIQFGLNVVTSCVDNEFFTAYISPKSSLILRTINYVDYMCFDYSFYCQGTISNNKCLFWYKINFIIPRHSF